MKKWYESKVLWVNAISLICIGLQAINQDFIVDQETQAVALSVINILLRCFTKHEIKW